MSKHTPGPWRIRHTYNIFGNRIDVGHEGSVATCGGHSSNKVDCLPETIANAKLIAAAPDLLAALKALLADYRDLSDSGDCGKLRIETSHVGKAAYAAIAKAEGKEQPNA